MDRERIIKAIQNVIKDEFKDDKLVYPDKTYKNEKSLITEETAVKLYKEGYNIILVNDKTKFTPSAEDYIKAKNIKIQRDR